METVTIPKKDLEALKQQVADLQAKLSVQRSLEDAKNGRTIRVH